MTQPNAVDPVYLAFQLAVAGRYSLDRELGRGGMGVVYLAREVHLDRSVAIKLLPPERAAQRTLRDRFLREARLAAKLSHPNIIPIHAVEETDGFVFYVMAYIEGETLAQRVRTRGPLPNNEGARVLREVAWALAHAHERGLVHRDVKPDNILLETSTGRVLVADFGIAGAFGDSGDGISGTPEFMSPEQALGTPLDARSDLYGLGATAFYAFSGRFPFEGKTATEVLAKQVTEPAPSLASLGVTVPRKIAALIDRCLAKAPDQRPESAQAMAEQLNVALELRKELPIALRAFVRRQARMNGGGTVIGWTSIGLGAATLASYTSTAYGFAAFGVLSVMMPLTYMTWVARRLLKLGFAHQDLDGAFKTEAERAKEELAAERRAVPYRIEGWLPKVMWSSWPVLVGSLASVAWAVNRVNVLSSQLGRSIPLPSWFPAAAYVMIGSSWIAMGSSIALIALRQRHMDVDNAFWNRIWHGKLGRAVFALAGKFIKPGERQTAVTHRATELSLGMAAEQLFESLPKETRVALGDIPDVLTRLQADAQELRKRHESVNDALNEAGDAAAGADYAEVREMRDALQARLADAVGALETIRLNLLRLHAGSASVESVTTHLDIAAEVSAEVERLIAAHADVERALNFPRTPAPSPV
ncbi:MAG TPA: serine/threonine-protein kinase [Gemmatimonadaceae bacterium]